MKTLLAAVALCLLAGCHVETEKADANHTAVTAYLKKNLDDPASYQPARWSAARVWRRGDEAKEKRRLLLEKIKVERDNVEGAHKDGKKIFAAAGVKTDPVIEATYKRDIAEIEQEEKQAKALPVGDTTRLGVLITHAFRAKNKMGGLVLDSAEFIVTPNGQAAPYAHPKN